MKIFSIVFDVITIIISIINIGYTWITQYNQRKMRNRTYTRDIINKCESVLEFYNKELNTYRQKLENNHKKNRSEILNNLNNTKLEFAGGLSRWSEMDIIHANINNIDIQMIQDTIGPDLRATYQALRRKSKNKKYNMITYHDYLQKLHEGLKKCDIL